MVENSKEYYNEHAVCPVCKAGGSVYATTAGNLGPRDTNKAVCGKCGWRGIVDEMVPRPTSQKEIDDLKKRLEICEEVLDSLIGLSWSVIGAEQVMKLAEKLENKEK